MVSHTPRKLVKKAIRLRNKGLSYSEIQRQVPVAKSTLSILLRNVRLNQKAKKIIEGKLTKGQKMGAKARRTERISRENNIKNLARDEIKKINSKDLFLMGLMLYWGEGSKARDGNISQQVAFANSDPKMCRLFLCWLTDAVNVNPDDIYFSIYINSIFRGKASAAINYWVEQMAVPKSRFTGIYFTNTKFSNRNKRESRKNYNGILRIRVKKSTDLNRRIAGWIDGVCVRSGLVSENRI